MFHYDQEMPQQTSASPATNREEPVRASRSAAASARRSCAAPPPLRRRCGVDKRRRRCSLQDHRCYEANVSPKDQSESLIFFKGRSRGLGLAGASDTKSARHKTLAIFPPGAASKTWIFSRRAFSGARTSAATQSHGRDKSRRSAGGAGKRPGGRAKGGNTAATL